MTIRATIRFEVNIEGNTFEDLEKKIRAVTDFLQEVDVPFSVDKSWVPKHDQAAKNV